MLASLALFGILGLPILNGAALRIVLRLAEMRPKIAPFTTILAVTGSILVLISAWIWWASNPELGDAVVGGWASISFTGTPLAIGFGAAACSVVIALAAARCSQLLDPNTSERVEVVSSHGLLMLGAALAVLGSTTPTLLIGIGIMDIAGVWHAARRLSGRVAIRIFFVQLLGLMLASLVLTMRSAGSGDFRLSASAVQSVDLFGTLMSAAIVMHANLLPFGISQHGTSNLQTSAGLLGAVVLVSQAAPVAPWVPALAAVSCAFWALHALGDLDANRREAHIRESAAAFALAFGMHAPHMMAVAWLLGNTLLEQSGLARILGGISLLALPGSTGFVITATIPEAGLEGPLGLTMAILQTGCRAILVFALLRHTFGSSDSSTLAASFSGSLKLRRLPALLVGAVHVFVLGLAPQFFGGPSLIEALNRTGVAAWASIVVGVALGVALWRIVGRELDDALGSIGNLLTRADAAVRPFYAALERLRRSFGSITSLLDSEGALLLTCLALVLAVLILGQATP